METFKIFLRILKLMKKNLPLYLIAIAMMTAMSSLFEVANSVFTKQVFDYAGNNNNRQAIIGLVMAALLGLAAVMLAAVFMFIYNNKAKWATLELKKAVFAKTLKMPMKYYDEHHSGEMLAMAVYDTDVASNIYSSRLRRVLAPVISVLVFAAAMLLINPIMAAVMLGINVLLFGLNTLIAAPVKAAGKSLSENNAALTEQLSDMIAGIQISKMYDNNKTGLKNYQRISKKYVSAQKKKMRLMALSEAVNKGFDLLCSLMFVIIGIIMIWQDLADVGEVAAIYTMHTMLSIRFLQLGKNYPELMNCIAYASKILKFIDEDEEKEEIRNECEILNSNDENIIVQEAAIQVKEVSYIYKNGSGITDKKTLTFPLNKLTAVTGRTGCGKSTLVKLIMGYYPLQSGKIYIFGKDIEEWGIRNARSNIAYIPQNPYLYEVSIMDNIRYARTEASDEEVIEAAKKANAHEFIMKCSDGYNTVISSRGNNLSGGERQRIAIARAILKDAPIIIMDEATSALDNKSEKYVWESIKNISAGKTVIMIAHRQSAIDMADVVAEM